MIIDAHIHYWGDHPDAVALLASVDAKLLNVAVTEAPGDTWCDQAAIGRGLAGQYPDRYAWCTTFDLPDAAVWASSGARLRCAAWDRRPGPHFAAGAWAARSGKHRHAVAQAPGAFVMVDEALFEPL